MIIAIFGRSISPVFYDSLKRLFTILHLHRVDVTVYRPFLDYMRSEIDFDAKAITDFSNHSELRNVDFFFSIGGDGAFLEAISLVRDSGIPMVGMWLKRTLKILWRAFSPENTICNRVL